MFVLQLVDYRVEFSKWWVSEFKTVKFPSQVIECVPFIGPFEYIMSNISVTI